MSAGPGYSTWDPRKQGEEIVLFHLFKSYFYFFYFIQAQLYYLVLDFLFTSLYWRCSRRRGPVPGDPLW